MFLASEERHYFLMQVGCAHAKHKFPSLHHIQDARNVDARITGGALRVVLFATRL